MMLHDFKSRLPWHPWQVYKMTQAPIHGLVSRIYQVEMVINNTLLEENQKNKPEQYIYWYNKKVKFVSKEDENGKKMEQH